MSRRITISKIASRKKKTGNIVVASATKFWLEAGGLLYGETLPGAEITLRNAQENIAVLSELGLGKRRPLFLDIRKVVSVTREAREYYASPETAEHIARLAFLIESPVSRLVGTFFLRLNKPIFPVRLFTSKSDALAWLREGAD